MINVFLQPETVRKCEFLKSEILKFQLLLLQWIQGRVAKMLNFSFIFCFFVVTESRSYA